MEGYLTPGDIKEQLLLFSFVSSANVDKIGEEWFFLDKSDGFVLSKTFSPIM